MVVGRRGASEAAKRVAAALAGQAAYRSAAAWQGGAALHAAGYAAAALHAALSAAAAWPAAPTVVWHAERSWAAAALRGPVGYAIS